MWAPRTTNAGSWAPRALQQAAASSAASSASTTQGIGIADLLEKRKDVGGIGAARKKPKSEFVYPIPPPDVAAAPASASAAAATGAAEASAPDAAQEAGAAPASKTKDEIVEAAPRLAEHIKSAAKFVKVATMACTLLEEGRVTMYNSEAFFAILEAGVADPKRIRNKEMRSAYRRLYGAALQRKDAFHTKRQAQLRLWHMQVINQIDLFSKHADQFARITKEIRHGLLLLPCITPSLEPPTRTGAPREHLPPGARRVWADSLFDCLEVGMVQHKQPWAATELNMLVKTAYDRRQNFTDKQTSSLAEWERMRMESSRAERKESERTDSTKREGLLG
mmetsp:Transcript_60186/g.138059  ORF Transcript_60186/g.138059 Transcript_60186/m.138059 type:complete len:336 (-) Transcript_60186:924-1931(-)